MPTKEISKAEACFGVCCGRHLTCQLYANVELKPLAFRIATCDNGDKNHPLFVHVRTTINDK
jgi:hypothetical protein